MKPLKWFRWKALIPLAVIILAVTLFCLLLIDSITKSVIISVGESIFAAKVEVGKVNVGVFHPGITLNKLSIADKNDPWKNLFAADELKFSVAFSPLLSKKLIIDVMSVKDITWGTKREKSGVLPPKKIRKIEKKQTKEDKDSFTSKLLDSLKQKASSEITELPAAKSSKEIEEIKSIDTSKMVTEFESQMLSKTLLTEMQSESTDKYNRYKQEISSIKTDETASAIKQASDEITSIKIQSPADAPATNEKIKLASEKIKTVEEQISKLKTLYSSASSDFAEEKTLLEKINGAVNSDYQSLLSKLKLPEINKSNIANAVFGKMWIERVNSTLRYFHLARKYFPPRKKQQIKTQFKRARGTDIIFHRENVLPGFLLREASISGTIGAIDVSGKIADVTSDPVLYGRPAILDISGRRGANKYIIKGIFDYTKDVPEDTLTISATGMPASGISLFEKGNLNIESKFSLIGETLDCSMEINISGLKFASRGSGDFNEILSEVLTGIKTIKVNAKMSGTMGNLKTQISSNIDGLIAEKLNSIYGEKVKEIRTRLKNELESRISAEKEKVLGEHLGKRKEIIEMISSKEALLSGAKKELEERIASQRKEIEMAAEGEKKKLEEEKKKAEEELKKKAGTLFK